MSDFVFLTPGSVRHREGWLVRSVGRSLVEYEEHGRTAAVEVERGSSSITIYPDTLQWIELPEPAMTPDERSRAAANLELGLSAISGKTVDRSSGRA